jgi:hypothetical protein
MFKVVVDVHSKTKACELLTARFAPGNPTNSNALLIAKLLGLKKGDVHCYLSKCPLAAKEREAYCCAIGTDSDGTVVGAACFRHVGRPRRASASQYGFTELLLLAVDKNEERKGLGRSMVDYVQECALSAGSERLIVVSNGHKFWRQPGLQFADLEPNHGLNLFVPWNAGIYLLVRCIVMVAEKAPSAENYERVAKKARVAVKAAAAEAPAAAADMGAAEMPAAKKARVAEKAAATQEAEAVNFEADAARAAAAAGAEAAEAAAAEAAATEATAAEAAAAEAAAADTAVAETAAAEAAAAETAAETAAAETAAAAKTVEAAEMPAAKKVAEKAAAAEAAVMEAAAAEAAAEMLAAEMPAAKKVAEKAAAAEAAVMEAAAAEAAAAAVAAAALAAAAEAAVMEAAAAEAAVAAAAEAATAEAAPAEAAAAEEAAVEAIANVLAAAAAEAAAKAAAQEAAAKPAAEAAANTAANTDVIEWIKKPSKALLPAKLKPLTADEAKAAAVAEGLELVPSSQNTTGFKNVTKRWSKYRTMVVENGKELLLGTFETAEEAALIYARHIGAERAATEAAKEAAKAAALTADKAKAAAVAEELQLVPSLRSSTGFKNVTKCRSKYKVEVSENGRLRYLGTFKTAEEAALIYARHIGAERAAAEAAEEAVEATAASAQVDREHDELQVELKELLKQGILSDAQTLDSLHSSVRGAAHDCGAASETLQALHTQRASIQELQSTITLLSQLNTAKMQMAARACGIAPRRMPVDAASLYEGHRFDVSSWPSEAQALEGHWRVMCIRAVEAALARFKGHKQLAFRPYLGLTGLLDQKAQQLAKCLPPRPGRKAPGRWHDSEHKHRHLCIAVAAVEGGTDERRLAFAKLFEILGIRTVKHRFGTECQNATEGGERSDEANQASDIYILYLVGELQVGWHMEEEDVEEDSWQLPPLWMPPP